ncbi:MAG: hypothetical protein KDK89_17390 [Alphaproteobacteria bacterium]|nr:hypothetical protein [Alphaproteobacteria bacterium]
MKWWLSVFFFINDAWVPGSSIDGWDPRPFDSEAICLERKARAEQECRNYPLDYDTAWVCSAGEPASAPPVAIPESEC